MFGVIAAGRLVETDFSQISEARFLKNIADVETVNHLVIFMTGSVPFPDGYGGLGNMLLLHWFTYVTYFRKPRYKDYSYAWILLTNSTNSFQSSEFYIDNLKPSAIFKLSKIKQGQQTNVLAFGQQAFSHTAQIGISIEPLTSIQFQTPTSEAEPSSVLSFLEFGQKMVDSLFNYVASFCVNVPGRSQQEMYVPMSALKNWYVNFERRLQQNPHFWKS
nr:EOG090X0D82 [Artemia franciscana]